MPTPDPAWNHQSWVAYLRRDIVGSIGHDIAPLIQTAGLFGVPRQVFCYADYLGALREGPGKGSLASTWKCVKFLQEVFGSVYAPYAVHAAHLVAAYRHGLVHTYAPKTLVGPTGRRLHWFVYRGRRLGESVSTGDRSWTVSHLNLIDNDAIDHLPVSIDCLVEDLGAAIERFCDEILAEEKSGRSVLLANLKGVASELMKPATVGEAWKPAGR